MWPMPQRMPSDNGNRPCILVCDDEAVLRDLVRACLEPDYEIVEASNGDESLRIARRLRPDLIVLDMMMPGTSGLDVLERLRSEPALASTPVVMLTARAQAADRFAAASAGADRYVPKPFDVRELRDAVAELIQQRR
jgi:two-component system phosphate regulon response regulator PhoB